MKYIPHKTYPRHDSQEQSIFYHLIFSFSSFFPTNWSYGWSRFTTASLHHPPPPPYQPPQYSMHTTMPTTTYGLKQPPQAIHLLQNNTREVRLVFLCAVDMRSHTTYCIYFRVCHQDQLPECHQHTVNLHPITRCSSIKIDCRDHHQIVHL